MISQPLAPGIAWRPRAVLALLLGYLALFGVLVGAQGVLWAEIIRALDLSKAQFGAVQLPGPLLSVGLLMLGAQFSHWFGKKTLALFALVLLAASNALLAVAAGLPMLIVALLLTGAGAALLETAANSATLDWEADRQRDEPAPYRLQRGRCAGRVGAGRCLGRGWTTAQVLLALAGLCGAMLLVSLPARFPPADTAAQDRPARWQRCACLQTAPSSRWRRCA